LLLIVAGWLIYWFINADLFYIHNIQVEGDWRLSEAELLRVSGLEGINVFWTDTQAAARAIEALPDVQSAQVGCRLPANCVVKLVERPVSLVWRQGDAEVWIGADGVVVPARGELPNAIVLDAARSAALKPGDQFDPTLLVALEELERRQPAVRVYQYSDRFELGFENRYGWPVRLGNGDEIVTKLALSQNLADYLLSQGIVPRFIDVRYLETPYYGE
jgi:cell division septal protein FtsQ